LFAVTPLTLIGPTIVPFARPRHANEPMPAPTSTMANPRASAGPCALAVVQLGDWARAAPGPPNRLVAVKATPIAATAAHIARRRVILVVAFIGSWVILEGR
jgi:hypothetical protein